MSLNVFWFLPTGGDSRFLGKSSSARAATNSYIKQIATTAEEFGYDGLLIPTGSGSLDPFITAATLANATKRIKLLVALRTSAVGGPTVFARQASTLDEALNGRLIINVVPGAYAEELAADGVFLNHDERYEAADEFLTIYRKLLSGEKVTFEGKYYNVRNAQNLFAPTQKPYPPLYFGGSSDAAHDLAAKHIDAYLSWGEPPADLAKKIADVKKRAEKLGRKIRFGVRFQVIVRDTEEKAWAAANELISRLDDDIIAKAYNNFSVMDSEGQRRITALHGGKRDNLEVYPNVWAGVGLIREGAGTALVGDPKQVADRLKEYAALGVDTFVLSGYPHLEEAVRFAELVFPLIGRKSVTLKDHVVTSGAFDSRIVADNALV